jgi:hypothetical protein
MTTGFQQQQPFTRSAAVRSVPSQRAATRLDLGGSPKGPAKPEEKSFDPRLER